MTEENCKCIYFDSTDNTLRFSKREHVIPASLGGKTKLSRGMVSDQANEHFSKHEMKAVRNTFLSINRNNNGPGKRGSLSVLNVNHPQINVFEVVHDQDLSIDTEFAPVRLGFLFCGNVYMIPQILFIINKDWSIKLPRIVMGTVSENAIKTSIDFIMNFNKYLLNRKRSYKIVNSNLKTNIRYVNIGIHDDKWFISTTLNKEYLEKFVMLIAKKGLPDDIPAFPSSVANYHYSYTLPDALDESFDFIYVKTAFNVLAYFTDREFVLQNQFDNIRSAIVNCYNFKKYFKEKTIPKWLIEWVNTEVKPKEHYIVINAEKNYIEAYVSFYHELIANSICLSDRYIGESFRKGFVCNWNNKSERFYKNLI